MIQIWTAGSGFNLKPKTKWHRAIVIGDHPLFYKVVAACTGKKLGGAHGFSMQTVTYEEDEELDNTCKHCSKNGGQYMK